MCVRSYFKWHLGRTTRGGKACSGDHHDGLVGLQQVGYFGQCSLRAANAAAVTPGGRSAHCDGALPCTPLSQKQSNAQQYDTS